MNKQALTKYSKLILTLRHRQEKEFYEEKLFPF